MKEKLYIIIMKTILSCICVALVFIDIFVSSVNIGYVTLLLLLFGILPWVGNLKSLEIFKLGKVEWFSKEQKENIKNNTEVLKQQKSTKKKKNYQFLYSDNIPLILAQLRMELEKRLTKLFSVYSINQHHIMGLNRMTDVLFEKEILDSQERNLIKDLLPSMNSAVHGKLDIEDSDRYAWVLEVSEILLNSIDAKLSKKGKNEKE